jgi:hypothetical protein
MYRDGMGTLVLAVLPLAIGAAISPTLLALQLLVLTGPTKRLPRAWALAGGSGLVLAAFSILGFTVLVKLHPGHDGHRSLRDALIMFVAGGLLGLLALRSLLHRPTTGEQQKSRMAGRMDTAPTSWFIGMGAIGMVVNFSTLLLYLPALHEITRSTVGGLGRASTFAMLYLITLLPVLVPVGLVTVLGPRADPALDATHGFVTRHSRRIGLVIEVVFAVYLVGKGVRELP